MTTVHLLDYVAGNVRSLVNAIHCVGYQVEWIKEPEDISRANKLILPGVGHFGHCLNQLSKGGFLEPISKHIEQGKPFLGICVGLQALFTGSAEDANVQGLNFIPGRLVRFRVENKSVPHIGWNSAIVRESGTLSNGNFLGLQPESKYYFVHSYAALYKPNELESFGWTVATSQYGDEDFVAAIGRGNIVATQFHPEKSGVAGLRVIRAFLSGHLFTGTAVQSSTALISPGLTRRIIACLDVRTNDSGDLVVTKGDQYDVRDKSSGKIAGQVRNLGKPVNMARRYYDQGADEITFLNITSFRNCPLTDLPMLEILRQTSETVFVPLTIGGGIRDSQDADGKIVSALDVATMYFQSGADKVSIGSDAVMAAEEYIRNGQQLSGKTAIETISAAYGNQAVVVSVDPRRVYIDSPMATSHHTISTNLPGPQGERYCWYQCTIKGGREGRDLDVRQLLLAIQAMGAGEVLMNCIDRDGSSTGFDLELIQDAKQTVQIPIIASSGAGEPLHFLEAFQNTSVDAALGAGMFHHGRYTVREVKEHLSTNGFLVRQHDEEL